MVMRIAIVTESFLPSVNGVTNSVLRILEYLEHKGHQALVIAPDNPGTPQEYAGHRVKTIAALPVQSLIPTGIPMALPQKKLEHILDGFAPDVIHLASPFALGAYTSRVARRLNIPTLSVYQTDLAGFARHYRLSAAHSALQRLVSKIHSGTNRTLAPSFPAIRELETLDVPNVHLWRRGVNAQLFHPKKRSSLLREQWGAPQKLIIGYVGRLAQEKRIHDLQYLDQDPTIQLVITGEGPAQEKLKELMPNAIFTGFATGENLAEIYASLDLFIHTGPNETFCQSIQEALASGVPCIVPPTGGPSDLVTHGHTGYIINTHRSYELDAAVHHFILRKDKKAMRTLARDSVAFRSWSSINQQLMIHYQELIAEKERKIEGVVA